jgi:class 3 adenylate cyclase
LFADVKGSMELAEQLDPEAWHKILDRFFQILTEGVHRFEGTVNQYTGDGIIGAVRRTDRSRAPRAAGLLRRAASFADFLGLPPPTRLQLSPRAAAAQDDRLAAPTSCCRRFR